ncbi:MAG: thioredoxin-dependent thiol peroxidase [Acidimicrobiia bacterium]|nr:thioredoxin-dependent thiol peroxidase [Acidimicrobiia bacterium]
MELKVGDKAPSFKCEDQDGNMRTEKEFRGAPYVIYFYPRASTPGCTVQSCELRDATSDLNSLNAKIIGVSPDTSKKQKTFDDKYTLGFPLLADHEHHVSESYGTWAEKSMYGKKYMGIIRSCFVVDEKGKIAGAKYKISPKDTVPFAEEILKSL